MHASALALSAALGCAATWPLPLRATRAFALGAEPSATVPFASAWALWWTAQRAAHGFTGYWSAPIFFPTQDAFALSEPMPALGLLAAPVLWCGAPLPLAYNFVLLAALALNGYAAFLLLRTLRVAPWAAIAGGCLVTSLPIVQHELGVLTLVALFPALLTLRGLLRVLAAPSLARGAGLGAAFALTFLCCAQYAVFVGLAGAAASPVLWPRVRGRGRTLLAPLSLALVVALSAIAPVALPQRAAIASHHFARSEAGARRGAANLAQWWRAPARELIRVPRLQVERKGRVALYPGTLRLLLASVGMGWALAQRGRRRAWAFLLALLLGSLLLSMLPRLHLGVVRPYTWLREVIPGFSQIRSLWRGSILAQLVLTLAAALGLHALARLRRHGGSWIRGRVSHAALAVAAVVATFELWPEPQQLASAPDPAAYARWAGWIRTHVPRAEPLVFWPFPSGAGVGLFEDTARFMSLQGLYERPMVNGYSSFFPAPHERLFDHGLSLGDASSLDLLRSFGVRRIVVRESMVPDARDLAARVGLRLGFRAPEVGLSVYEIP